MSLSRRLFALALSFCLLGSVAAAQFCPVIDEKPPGTPGQGLMGEAVGSAFASLGDPNGDGTIDIFAGLDDDPASASEAGFWMLSFNVSPHPEAGVLAASSKYSLPPGVVFEVDARFGASAALLGDLDEDGTLELAVGAPGEEQGAGALYVLSFDPVSLNAVSTVRIAGGAGGLLSLQSGDAFGASVAAIGDLNGDKFDDLVVGAPGSDEANGAVWILFLGGGGTVVDARRIAGTGGALPGMVIEGGFGAAVSRVGSDGADLNGDGIADLAVGAPTDGAGGAIWILCLNRDGSLISAQHVSATSGGFVGPLAQGDGFGSSLAYLGAPEGEGCQGLLAVGAPGTTDWAVGQGVVWYLCLSPSGSVLGEQRVSSSSGGFAGFLQEQDGFGSAVAVAGDFDGNQLGDLVVGAPGGAARAVEPAPFWSIFHGAIFIPRALPFGEGNPGTLAVQNGLPYVGTVMSFALDAPSAPPTPAPTLLHVSTLPDPLAPIGSSLAGYAGQLLVDLAACETTVGPLWQPNAPAIIAMTLPFDLDLIGVSLFVQGTVATPGQLTFSNGQRLVVAY